MIKFIFTKNFTDDDWAQTDGCPLLVGDTSEKFTIIENTDQRKNTGNYVPDDRKIWRRLSLQSLKRRRQKKEEDKHKPVFPAVLRTYDRQVRFASRSENNFVQEQSS